MENSDSKQITLPVEWNFGNIANKYATNMLIQAGENEFFLSFFEIAPPILFSSEDENKIDSLKAECVARIIVSKDKMRAFVDAMQKSVEDNIPSFED